MSEDELAPLPPLSSSSLSTKTLPEYDDGGTTLPLSVSFDSPNFLESSERKRRKVEQIPTKVLRQPTKAVARQTLFARFGKSGSSSSGSDSSGESWSVDEEEESDREERRKRRRKETEEKEKKGKNVMEETSLEDVTSVADSETKVAVIVAPVKSIVNRSIGDLFLFNEIIRYAPARTARRAGDARKTRRSTLVRRGASVAKWTAAGTANVGGQS